MSWPDRPSRRRTLALIGAGAAAAGCGFVPAYGPQGGAGRLQGATAVAAPDTPFGFRLRSQLESRLGPARDARYLLSVTAEVTGADAAVSATGAVGRRNLVGRATYRLTDGPDGPVIAEGLVEDFTGHAATGGILATRAAAEDAEARLAILLADAILSRLAAAAA
jgi:LPS-assembly lipoprotein